MQYKPPFRVQNPLKPCSRPLKEFLPDLAVLLWAEISNAHWALLLKATIKLGFQLILDGIGCNRNRLSGFRTL